MLGKPIIFPDQPSETFFMPIGRMVKSVVPVSYCFDIAFVQALPF